METVEILLHNVSHSDLVLCSSDNNDILLARPNFNYFKPISRQIYELVRKLNNDGEIPIKYYPVFGRVTGRNPTLPVEIVVDGEAARTPVGFDLIKHPVTINNKSYLRLPKTGIAATGESSSSTVPFIASSVCFPLLSVLLYRWRDILRHDKRPTLHLFLISGVGTPPNPINDDLDMDQIEVESDSCPRIDDNSTEFTAHLMRLWLKRIWPEIHVHTLHSPTHSNLFRYDDNLSFVLRELQPLLDDLRDEAVRLMRQYGGSDWRNFLRLTFAYADGASARVNAINSAIHSYRPLYMHFWQLKTFFHQNRICVDDVEIHSFEDFAATPAIPVEDAPGALQLLVQEMIKFKAEFDRVVAPKSAPYHELADFWMRKTKKPVLAVLLVAPAEPAPGADLSRPETVGYRLYRGTNMEVSMPTGSLCAERNVIGSALASDLALRREQLLAVAVLSVQLPSHQTKAASPPHNNELSNGYSEVASVEDDGASNIDEWDDSSSRSSGVGMRNALPLPPVVSISIPGPPTGVRASWSQPSSSVPSSPSSAMRLTRTIRHLSVRSKTLTDVDLSPHPLRVSFDSALDTDRLVPAHTPRFVSSHSVNDLSDMLLNGSTGYDNNSHSDRPERRDRSRSPVTLQKEIPSHLGDDNLKPDGVDAGKYGCVTRCGDEDGINPFKGSTAKANEGRAAKRYSRAATAASVLAGDFLLPEKSVSKQAAVVDLSLTAPLTPSQQRLKKENSVLLITVHESDMNPLRPCGACQEWLRKLAEVNPRFRVLTFTDSACTGVIIEPVEGT